MWVPGWVEGLTYVQFAYGSLDTFLYPADLLSHQDQVIRVCLVRGGFEFDSEGLLISGHNMVHFSCEYKCLWLKLATWQLWDETEMSLSITFR